MRRRSAHRLREGLVRLAGDGAEGHGSGVEALHDLANRLDLLEGDRQGRLVLEAKETPAETDGRHKAADGSGESKTSPRTLGEGCPSRQLRTEPVTSCNPCHPFTEYSVPDRQKRTTSESRPLSTICSRGLCRHLRATRCVAAVTASE